MKNKLKKIADEIFDYIMLSLPILALAFILVGIGIVILMVKAFIELI
jgi:hypothetical protein